MISKILLVLAMVGALAGLPLAGSPVSSNPAVETPGAPTLEPQTAPVEAIETAGTATETTLAAQPPPPTPAAELEAAQQAAFVAAIEEAIPVHKDRITPLLLYDTTLDSVQISSTGQAALVFVAMIDPTTGEPSGAEPLIGIARPAAAAKMPAPGAALAWQVIFPQGDEWETELAALPEDLRSPELVQRFQVVEAKAAGQPLGGYLLPWAGAATKRLTWSVSHTSCTNCEYAFDFSDGTMFPILAAKGGTVHYARWHNPNGSTAQANMLVIKDPTTNPPTHVVYYHLAQNSIPEPLRVPGTPVYQGQFIGLADDTGYSSGHHLHFMVFPASYGTWGPSMDITFRDVSINWDAATQGGRPRLEKEAAVYGGQGQTNYTSGNYGAHPPTGGLTAPGTGITVSGPTVRVSGWGSDDMGVSRFQVLANHAGTWREAGPAQTSNPFAFDLNLCEAGIPDGPVSLALKVWDYEGNQTLTPLDIRNVYNASPCPAPPPPACTPGASQVALFSEPNFGEPPYNGGTCRLFGVGNYPTAGSLGSLGGDNAASLRLGRDVSATLYSDENFTGRAETLTANNPATTLLDRSLADNLIGNDNLSSLRVDLRTEYPSAPVLTPATNRLGQSPTADDSLVLAWRNAGGATKFEARLYQGSASGTLLKSLGFTTDPWWSIGSLAAGTYTWQVRGRVANYDNTPYYSSWSSQTFTVGPAAGTVPPAQAFPFTDGMENGANGWTASGLWQQDAVASASGDTTTAWIFNNGTAGGGDYADAAVRAGDLTSPPIAIPAGTPAYLRFATWTDTEDNLGYFDQRRVQVSMDGGPFADVAGGYLSGDPALVWLKSPVIDLSPYAGHSVRVRFHFDIIDGAFNSYGGWAIDDVSVTATPPPACSESPANDTYTTGALLAYGGSAEGEICPAGDVDYYKFTGSQGDLIQADVVARGLAPASPLDPLLALLDGDGRSVLAENDDMNPGIQQDSHLVFRLPAAGTYYLKVKAWDHGAAGGTDHDYRVSLAKVTDTTPPVVAMPAPIAEKAQIAEPIEITVLASDNAGGSGVSRVEFYRHSQDWVNGAWELLGTDWDGHDGWSQAYDPRTYPDGGRSSFYARAYDWAGNSAGAVAWFESVMVPVAYLPVMFR